MNEIRIVSEPVAGFTRGSVINRPKFWWDVDEGRRARTVPIEEVVAVWLEHTTPKRRGRPPKASVGETDAA